MRCERIAGFGSAALAAGALIAMVATPVLAEPAFSRLYRQHYGYTPGCHACHKDGGGTPINAYGEQFKAAGATLAAFAAIADLDADGNGISNDVQARAKANPGDPRSTPDDPGSWLDSEALIPREVQRAFPGVRSWLPRDAILGESDIERARALGAELTREDGTTIYIPVEARRPVGTAVIVPAEHEGKAFFLLLTTDRQLKVARLESLDTRNVPEAEGRDIYARFTGTPLNELPSADGDDLDAAITRAVKRYGTLVWVRLRDA